MKLDLQFETSIRIILLLQCIDSETSEDKAMYLDLICRVPSFFNIKGRMLEGETPMLPSQFISSMKTFRKAMMDLYARNLIEITFGPEGILIKLTKNGIDTVSMMHSPLAEEYRAIAKEVLNTYGHEDKQYLESLINTKFLEKQS